MKDEVLDKVTDIGAAAAQLGAGVGRVKEAVADAVEDADRRGETRRETGPPRGEKIWLTTPNIKSNSIRSARSASFSVSDWDWEP